MKPSVGRIVHYTPRYPDDKPGGPWAALIVFVAAEEVDGMPLVNLTGFDPHGDKFAPRAVKYSEEPTPGCWSWPPRV